jgi:AcrR family transcriptional regulator
MTPRPRERILAAATRLFLEEGIQAVGVARIIREARVAQMTPYRQFGGKDGVIVAALEQWCSEWTGWLLDEVDRCGDGPEARFAGLWAALERRFASKEFAGSLVLLAAVELRRVPDHPTWKVIAEHQMAMRQLLEDLVKPLGVADPTTLAARLQLLMEGAAAAATAGMPVGAPGLRALAEAACR